MGKKIHTATGTIDSDEMGTTSLHEHVPIDRAHSDAERADAVQYCIDELNVARRLGLKTIVEVSTRRDAERIKKVSEESGVNIVVCTGFYVNLTDDEKAYSVDQYRRHMLNEIEHGIGTSGIYPGVIKLASVNEKLTDFEQRVFEAGGRVQRETGLPICTHAVAGCKRQRDILEYAGADLLKVYYSHVEAEFGWEGRSLEQQIDYLCEVVRSGGTLSYNNFGNWAHTSKESLATIIRAMAARGFADHQVATMDFVFDYEDGNRKVLWDDINVDGKLRTYAYLLSHAVPWMASEGITASQVDKMVVGTPRRIFGT